VSRSGRGLHIGRSFGAVALMALVALVASPVGASAAGGHHRRGHKRHHRRPHRQAVAGPIAGAKVPVAKAPTIVGKGGGADPGDDYPAELKNAPQDSRVDHWGEYNRECTSFVAWALYSRNGFTMPFHDNANNWGPDAVHRGYVVNSSPAIGSVAWSNAGFYGHVAYVVAAGGGNVTIEEYNHWGNGTYDKRTVAASAFTGYIHFKDIPAEPPSTPVSTPSSPSQTPSTPTTGSPGSTPSQPASPAPTHSETTGGLAHTWTNYTNAGGYEGPAIPSNATVQIACAVQGFRVADGNTWWYRIASSPWSGNYYVSADAFYNNGQTSGSLIGTPFVDPAVSSC